MKAIIHALGKPVFLSLFMIGAMVLLKAVNHSFGVLGCAWITFLFALGFPGILRALPESDGRRDDDEIGSLDKQLKQLVEIEATIQSRYAAGAMADPEYQQKMALVFKHRKALEEKLNDSVASIIFQDIPDSSDPLSAINEGRRSIPAQAESPGEDGALQILEVKRGHIKDARVLEIKFLYRQQQCKALIDNQQGRWRIQTGGEAIYMYLFKNALENSRRFCEVFEVEIKRYPQAWHEVVVRGIQYKEHNLEKDTRDNFPEECKQILYRFGGSETAVGDLNSPSPESAGPVASRPVVIRKVEHGEYGKAGRKDFGKGYQEFARYIVVLLDWGEYPLRAEINTDSRAWEVIPRAPIQDFSKELLREFRQVVPLMVQELEQAKNKFLAGVISSEMRKKEYRHQWEFVVKAGCKVFPRDCLELFQRI